MEYVPSNFKLSFLQCPPPVRDNTCLALTHFPLHLAALPTHNQRKCHLLSPYTLGAALFTPETIRPTATLSQSLFTQPGTNRDPRSSWLCWQHQGHKNAKQEQWILSRRKWAPSSGRPHLTFWAIAECGNIIEKQNWGVLTCHANEWSHVSLEQISPTSPFKFWHTLCSTSLNYLFMYLIISWECIIFQTLQTGEMMEGNTATHITY